MPDYPREIDEPEYWLGPILVGAFSGFVMGIALTVLVWWLS